jgi:hypothetical protein
MISKQNCPLPLIETPTKLEEAALVVEVAAAAADCHYEHSPAQGLEPLGLEANCKGCCRPLLIRKNVNFHVFLRLKQMRRSTMNLVLCLSSHRLHDAACHNDSLSHRTLSMASPFKSPFSFGKLTLSCHQRLPNASAQSRLTTRGT